MRAFYDVNLRLAQLHPAFRFHDLLHPIYTRPRFLPGSRIYDVSLDQVLLSDGCVVQGAEIQDAVIGIRSVISAFPPNAEVQQEHWEVHEGIVVIPKNSVIFDGTVIQP